MTRRTCLRAVAAIALSTTLLMASPARAASPAIIHVQGLTTTWDLSLLHIRSMYRIPHFEWTAGYRFFRLFVLTLRLTNTGQKAADPFDDMMLTLKVMPPHVTHYTAGWTSVPHKGLFIPMLTVAGREFGGVPPWTMTQPGHTTVYCYVIATNRGDAHYGLYNFVPYKRIVFLLDTGM